MTATFRGLMAAHGLDVTVTTDLSGMEASDGE